MSEFWNDVKRHGAQGRDELFKAMYPDFPSGWSGFQPDRDQTPEVTPSLDERSLLDDRLQIAASRDDLDRDDPEPER